MPEHRDQDARDQATENLESGMPEKFGKLLL